jgi:hypothetical protein
MFIKLNSELFSEWRHDAQHNNIQFKDSQHNGVICDTQHE